MRELIASDYQDDFARGFTEALIEYGLGRPFGFTDDDLASEIIASAKSQNYQMADFIHGLVRSNAFHSK